MFKAFYWMFENKDYKKHVITLAVISIVTIFMGVGVSIYSNTLIGSPKDIIIILTVLLSLVLMLIFSGYFWELTDNIIHRTYNIQASEIFDGKVKKVYKIELPQFNVFRFIWRGLASVVANTIMILPFIIISALGMASVYVADPNPDASIVFAKFLSFYVTIGLLYLLLIPGLLWNYAKQNSVFSMLNWFKSIHLLATYPVRYLTNIIFFIAYAVIIQCCVYLISNLFVHLINPADAYILKVLNIIVYNFVYCVSGLYFIYVQAYLIGTIAPESEY